MTLVELLGTGATVLGSTTGVWAFMSARYKAKATAPARIATSQADLVQALNAQTKILLGENAKDREDLKWRIDRQDIQIGNLEAKVASCEAKHAQCETNLADLRAELERKIEGRTHAAN